MNRLVATMDSNVHTVSSNLPMDNSKEYTDNKMAMISSNLPMDNRKDDMLRSRLESLRVRRHKPTRAAILPRVRGTMHTVSNVSKLY
jgi:ribosomal protein L30E